MVCESIKNFHTAGVWVEVTTLVIEGKNDSDEELQHVAEFIASVDPCIPWHLSAAYPTFQMTDFDRTSYATLIRAYNIGKKAGLRFIYLGNVSENEHQCTNCPKCGKLLVRRGRGYGYGATVTSDFDVKQGRCKGCGESIPGRWTF